MTAPTYRVSALVLRKTKLGEADLILTLLAQDGSQLRVVAKGARKPRSSFASRLELYSEAELLCVRGRSLDIVKEARLAAGHDRLRTSPEQAAGAACMAELLERVSQTGLPTAHLFDATHVALDSLERSDREHAPLITAAHLLKALSFSGLRPSLARCVLCDEPLEVTPEAPDVRFSVIDGGVVCARCACLAQTQLLRASTLLWARAALGSTFAQLEAFECDVQAGIDLLQLVQGLTREHVGAPLKSVRFMLTAGLF